MTIAEQMNDIAHKAQLAKAQAETEKVAAYYQTSILTDIRKLAEKGKCEYHATMPCDIDPLMVRKVAEADGFNTTGFPHTRMVLIMWRA
jgi:hypothetical protein